MPRTIATIAVGDGGGGTLYIVINKNAKIAVVHPITSLWAQRLLETKLFIRVCKKSKTKAFYFNLKF
jgi:hypothetical protein